MKHVIKFLENMAGICIYALIFCFLLGIACPDMSTREYIGYSFILGFFAGAINNIERVLRELFDKQQEA